MESLTSTSVTATLDVAVEDVEAWFFARRLEDMLRGSDRIPAVRGTVLLSQGWGQPGNRRRVELEDDSTALEQVLDNELPARFHYVVWNYTSKVARYVDYGIGEFRFEPAGEAQTRVTWTYAFKPKKTLYRGPLRRFVEGDYRAFMSDAMERMREHAARWEPGTSGGPTAP